MNNRNIMSSLLTLSFLLSSPGIANSAIGSSFGTLTTAKPLGQGRANFGVGVGLGDATSVLGSLTYGLGKYTDGRIRLSLTDPPNKFGDTKIALGADFKWQFWDVSTNSTNPFDFAFGGFLEYASFDRQSVLQIGGQLIASYPLKLNSGGVLTPYGKFNTRLESLGEFTLPSGAVGGSESNLETGFSGGVLWKMSPNVWLYGEFQLDGNDGLFFGIDFNVQ